MWNIGLFTNPDICLVIFFCMYLLKRKEWRKKWEAVRVEGYENKARSRHAEELLLDSALLAVSSECKGITGKISGRTAVWSTVPSENSLGL